MRFLFLIITTIFLSSCASLGKWQEQNRLKWIQKNCNKNIAYQTGVNDGKNRRDMNNVYAVKCPEDTRAELSESYQEGYRFGLKNAEQDIVINQSDPGETDRGFKTRCIIRDNRAFGYLQNTSNRQIRLNGAVYFDFRGRRGQLLDTEEDREYELIFAGKEEEIENTSIPLGLRNQVRSCEFRVPDTSIEN